MKNPLVFFKKAEQKNPTLADYWGVTELSQEGFLKSPRRCGFMFELDGIDGSFLTPDQLTTLHTTWRSALRLSPGDELQIVFRKRVEFARWVEEQLKQAFLTDNAYGRRILLDRLACQVQEMGNDPPRLLSQKTIACYWTQEILQRDSDISGQRQAVHSLLSSFGLRARALDRSSIEREIFVSAHDLDAAEEQSREWPSLKIEAEQLLINDSCFRALELKKLPENYTQLGMIQAITSFPYPMDIGVRLKGKDIRPIISRLERKRNVLQAQTGHKNSPSAPLESQISQIDEVLRSLADHSESVFELQLTIGLRMPKSLATIHRQTLADVMRAAGQMDFCELEETTLGTFDSYLECIPGFSGANIKSHLVLGSNAIHFLPLFRPAAGDYRTVANFHTTHGTLYGIDPVAPHLANYNWLVSGTSGSGKSFFVNSLLAQSVSLDPNIFIVDIGGSYNKLVQFLGGQVMSLELKEGFELSPFFLEKSKDPQEEKLRRQHIYQIFLEMTRVNGQLPNIEVRHSLLETLNTLFEKEELPDHPISYLIDELAKSPLRESQYLKMSLRPWAKDSYFGRFLDNKKTIHQQNRIIAFDLKGLTDFEDLSRVVQLIICSSLWAKVRNAEGKRFSWIVLDEVAFSLLKLQPQFVDELVSTLRKHYAGAVIVVQDLEKVTSNLAGSSILQNTQSKAILQQRGNPKNYSEALSLTPVDEWAIQSLRREKGAFSDIFLIRDDQKTVIRHVPSELEYWLATTSPEDNQILSSWTEQSDGRFQDKVIDFVQARKKGGTK